MSADPQSGRRRGGRPDAATLVIALALAALGALLIREGGRLPDPGGYSGIGAGDVPRLIGSVLVGLGVWTAVAAWRDAPEPTPRQEAGPVLWIVGGLAAQLLLLGVTGFSVATGLLFAAVARAFGRRELWLSIPLGIAFALAVYGVFDRLLELNLPAGPPETLIFGG
jgi:putative tricarboxylic transport membrane protein